MSSNERVEDWLSAENKRITSANEKLLSDLHRLDRERQAAINNANAIAATHNDALAEIDALKQQVAVLKAQNKALQHESDGFLLSALNGEAWAEKADFGGGIDGANLG